MDVTPMVPDDRQVIQGYGDGRFRINGSVHEGSVLIFPGFTLPWPVTSFDEVTPDTLQQIQDKADEIEILLLGCGTSMQLVTSRLRQPLRDKGIVTEPMDTGAACRTYNVLVAEERRVAAALIAV